MELSMFTPQYWSYTFGLLNSFNGFLALSVSFLTFFAIGYYLHRLFHSCADSTKHWRNQYERWHHNLVLTKKSLALFHSRLQNLHSIIMLLLVPAAGLLMALFYSRNFRSYLFSLRGVLLGLFMATLSGIIIAYRRYLNYKLRILKADQAKYEAEKDLNINAVLGELTPSMKIGLREKLMVEAQAMLDKQNVSLQRLSKEIDMYHFALHENSEMVKDITRFKWCDECAKQIKDVKSVEDAKKNMRFKCPNKCLKKYFEECDKIFAEFKSRGEEVKQYKEEARKLHEEEKLIEASKTEEVKAIAKADAVAGLDKK